MFYRPRTFIRDWTALLVRSFLLKVGVLLAKRYPEPTKENVWHPNAHILFGLLGKYLEYEQNWGRRVLFHAVFKVLIDEYQRHTFYRYRVDWFIDELRKSKWLPRTAYKMSFWEEPRELEAGTLFPTRKLQEVIKEKGEKRANLIQDLILSAGEGRKYQK